MKGKHIKLLRERARLSQAEMSNILNISLRTLAKWESDENTPISQAYTKVCRDSFENLILVPVLRMCAEKIFEVIQAEFVSIWLVRHSLAPIQYAHHDLLPGGSSFWEVVLHENSCRYQCLCKTDEEYQRCFRKDYCDRTRSHLNERSVKNMGAKNSQTTYPLQSGEILNLAGDDIMRFSKKYYPDRVHYYYNDKTCHSVLKVPYHIPTTTGPQPAVLLTLDNKLQQDDNMQWRVIPFPSSTSGVKAFTQDDENRAKTLIKKLYEKELKELTEAFDYIPSEDEYTRRRGF